jgi:hypothetical protein
LIVDGFHVPVMPLLDVAGRIGAVLFWQIGPIAVKVGVTWVAMVISIVMVIAH